MSYRAWQLLGLLLVLIVVSMCRPAAAEERALEFHVGSYHLGDRKRDWNEVNPGIGYSYMSDSGHGYSLGGYVNSQYRTSYYAGYQRRLMYLHGAEVSILAGGATGYSKSFGLGGGLAVKRGSFQVLIGPGVFAFGVRHRLK